MARRFQGNSDPRWIEAKFAGKCGKSGCEQPIRKGEKCFYYPGSRTILAMTCGHADDASRDFGSHAFDEDNCTW